MHSSRTDGEGKKPAQIHIKMAIETLGRVYCTADETRYIETNTVTAKFKIMVLKIKCTV